MKEYSVTIEGTVPLLHHRYVFRDETEAAGKKKTGSIDYSSEWKKALYWNSEAGLYQPASHIEGALIRAAANFQITGKGKKTYKDLTKSSIFVAPEYISYGYGAIDADALLQEGRILIHKAVVVVQRARVERYRPMIPAGWKLSFTLQSHDDQFQKNMLKEILDYGGKYIGIGDFRPRYGRFFVVGFDG